MTSTRAKQPRRTLNTGAKAVQRAIAKANPTKEPPIVGKPVIIDPVKPNAAGRKSRQRRKTEGDPH